MGLPWRRNTSQADEIGIHEGWRGSLHAPALSIEPPYLGHTHGPVDKVRKRHGAVLKGPAPGNQLKLLFVNKDQAIVHDSVMLTFSFTRIWTAPHRAVKIPPSDLALLRVEVDEGCAPATAIFGRYLDRTTAQLPCKLVLDEDPRNADHRPSRT